MENDSSAERFCASLLSQSTELSSLVAGGTIGAAATLSRSECSAGTSLVCLTGLDRFPGPFGVIVEEGMNAYVVDAILAQTSRSESEMDRYLRARRSRSYLSVRRAQINARASLDSGTSGGKTRLSR